MLTRKEVVSLVGAVLEVCVCWISRIKSPLRAITTMPSSVSSPSGVGVCPRGSGLEAAVGTAFLAEVCAIVDPIGTYFVGGLAEGKLFLGEPLVAGVFRKLGGGAIFDVNGIVRE